MKTGIDLISFYTPNYFLDLKVLAEHRGVDKDKFYLGIGQEKMAIPPPDEDIVTMAASAAEPILEKIDRSSVELMILATESGIDQSKAAALFAHSLLELPRRCRAVELKEACYAATAGLQLAASWVKDHPDKKALVIGTDIARYDLRSPGEPTQGAGAVAMLVTTEPRVLALDAEYGNVAANTLDRIPLCVGDLVIFTENNYKLGLRNGSLGRIVGALPVSEPDDPCCRCMFEGGEYLLDSTQVQTLSHSYSITVHKSQGSQFTRVIVPIRKSRLLDQTLIYTAVTRGVDQVVLVGDLDATNASIKAPATAARRNVMLPRLLTKGLK